MVAQVQPEQSLVSQIRIKVGAQEVSPEVIRDLTHAVIESSVHLPDMAVLEFGNSGMQWCRAKIPLFQMGQELRIDLGEGNYRREVFVGETASLELDLDDEGKTPLRIRAYDRAHRLHRGRFTRSFTNVKDSDIAKSIAAELELNADVKETREVHEYLLQNNQTNWEFLHERATRLGFELQVRGNTLVLRPPPSTPAEVIDLSWEPAPGRQGGQLYSLRARMTTSEQANEVEVRGWDPLNKKEVVGRATSPEDAPTTGQKKTGGDVAKEAFKRKVRVVIAREPIYSQDQAERLAQSVLNELGSTFVMIEGAAMGDPRLRLGSEVNLPTLSDQFGGKYVVTEARHLYDASRYQIEFKVTGRRSTDVVSLLAPSAPPQTHVLTGLVTNNKDPREVGRVKVKMPLLGQDIESHWCRVVAPGAGPERGLEYLPEVDDEVLLVGHDINHLFVLGGLWNLRDGPPHENSQAISGGRVTKRVIRSRSGHVIALDDSDGGGSITIVDSTEKNKIVIDTAKNSLAINAQGNIKLEAGGSLEIVAGQDIKIEASTSLKAEAGTSASVEAKGGNLDLKGTAQANLKGMQVNIGQ